MRIRWWMAVAALGLLVAAACSLGTAAGAGDGAAKPKEAPPARWEYRVLTKGQVADLAKKDVAAGLNKLGDEGWELVTVEPPTVQQATFYFKRPARRAAPAPADEEEFKAFSLKNAAAPEAAKILQELLGTDGKRIRIVADPATNQVLARAPVDDLFRVAKILEMVDISSGK